MSGELNGTKVIIANGTGDIFGQGETSRSNPATPIDISNKSYEDNVTLMDGELSGKQETIPLTITFSDDAEFKKMRSDAVTGVQDTYTITYGASGYIISASFAVTGWSETFPQGGAVTASCTLMSSGVVTYTDPV